MLMRPLVGAIWPLIMLKQVLLPAPLGPISASISPGLEREADILDRLEAGIGFAEILDCENVHGALPPQSQARAAQDSTAPTTPLGKGRPARRSQAQRQLGVVGLADDPDRQRR